MEDHTSAGVTCVVMDDCAKKKNSIDIDTASTTPHPVREIPSPPRTHNSSETPARVRGRVALWDVRVEDDPLSGQGWQSVLLEDLLHADLLEHLREHAVLALDGDQLLHTLVALRDPRGRRRSERQQPDDIVLLEHGRTRVAATDVALPVRVFGNVGGGHGHGVGVGDPGDRPWRGVAVGGVERDSGGAVRIDGEDAADLLPDADRVDGVFLTQALTGAAREPWRKADLVDGDDASGDTRGGHLTRGQLGGYLMDEGIGLSNRSVSRTGQEIAAIWRPDT